MSDDPWIYWVTVSAIYGTLVYLGFLLVAAGALSLAWTVRHVRHLMIAAVAFSPLWGVMLLARFHQWLTPW